MTGPCPHCGSTITSPDPAEDRIVHQVSATVEVPAVVGTERVEVPAARPAAGPPPLPPASALKVPESRYAPPPAEASKPGPVAKQEPVSPFASPASPAPLTPPPLIRVEPVDLPDSLTPPDTTYHPGQVPGNAADSHAVQEAAAKAAAAREAAEREISRIKEAHAQEIAAAKEAGERQAAAAREAAAKEAAEREAAAREAAAKEIAAAREAAERDAASAREAAAKIAVERETAAKEAAAREIAAAREAAEKEATAAREAAAKEAAEAREAAAREAAEAREAAAREAAEAREAAAREAAARESAAREAVAREAAAREVAEREAAAARESAAREAAAKETAARAAAEREIAAAREAAAKEAAAREAAEREAAAARESAAKEVAAREAAAKDAAAREATAKEAAVKEAAAREAAERDAAAARETAAREAVAREAAVRDSALKEAAARQAAERQAAIARDEIARATAAREALLKEATAKEAAARAAAEREVAAAREAAAQESAGRETAARQAAAKEAAAKEAAARATPRTVVSIGLGPEPSSSRPLPPQSPVEPAPAPAPGSAAVQPPAAARQAPSQEFPPPHSASQPVEPAPARPADPAPPSPQPEQPRPMPGRVSIGLSQEALDAIRPSAASASAGRVPDPVPVLAPAVLTPDTPAAQKPPAKSVSRSRKGLVMTMLFLLALILGGGAAALHLIKKMANPSFAKSGPQPPVPSMDRPGSRDPNAWQEEAREALSEFLKADTPAGKAAFSIRGSELLPRMIAFYGPGPVDDSDTPLSGFAAENLPPEDHKRGIYRMTFDRPPQFELKEFFGPIAPLEVQMKVEEPDLLLSSLARVGNFTSEPVKVDVFFKRTPDGLKIDWETFVQTKHRTFRNFTELADPGQNGVFRVFVMEDVPEKGRATIGHKTYKIIDPAYRTDSVRVEVPVDSELGRALSKVNWLGVKDARPVTKTATLELGWTVEANPRLTIKRFLCWEFLGIGGEAVR